jgi:hypothetical protein
MPDYTITETEYATIAGVPLATPAWTLINLWELWTPPTVRGTDVVMPGAEGQRPYPRTIDATRRQLQLVIYGDVDWEGTPVTDARAGLWTNVEHLRTNIATPPGTGPGGTHTIELITPDGTVSGHAHIETMTLGGADGPYATRAAIDLTIVEGALR